MIVDAIVVILPVLISLLVTLVPAVGLVLKKIGSINKEFGELMVAISLALEDGKLTGDEIRNIIEEGGDVIDIIRAKTIERSRKSA